jgi:hypothetical protein
LPSHLFPASHKSLIRAAFSDRDSNTLDTPTLVRGEAHYTASLSPPILHIERTERRPYHERNIFPKDFVLRQSHGFSSHPTSGWVANKPIFRLDHILKVNMKGRPIDRLVYEHMFPQPTPTDPQNFHALQKNIISEVRLETACFYGSLDSREAQYPGLDYSHPPHRMRLGRFPWHRELFRTFDALRLTKSEIAGLTKWEGTRWAKESFEKEKGIKIRDTTGDCIQDWVDPRDRQRAAIPLQAQEVEMLEASDAEENQVDEEDEENEVTENVIPLEVPETMDEDEDDSDLEIQSVGLELNERLRARAAMREAGDAATVMDDEWEQWLKEAVEAGGLSFLAGQGLGSIANASAEHSSAAQSMSPRMEDAARLGQLQEIPDFLQSLMQQNIGTTDVNWRRLLGHGPPTYNRGNYTTGSTRARSIPSPEGLQRTNFAPRSPVLRRISLTRSHPASSSPLNVPLHSRTSSSARSPQAPRS